MSFQQNAFQHNAFQVGIEAGAAPVALDDGDSWFGGVARQVAVGLMAAAVSTATLAHKVQQVPEELPSSTVSGSFATSHNVRASQETSFTYWWQGDDLPEQAAPTFVSDDAWEAPKPLPQVQIPLILWDDQEITPKLEEDYDWKPPVIVSVKVSPLVWEDAEIVPQPVETVVEESDWQPTTPPAPTVKLLEFVDPDFTPEAAVEEQDWAPEKVRQLSFAQVFWADDDIVPQPAATIVDDSDWQLTNLPQVAIKLLDLVEPDFTPPAAVEEQDWVPEKGKQSLASPAFWYDDTIVPQPSFTPNDDIEWKPPVVLIGANGVLWATDEEIVPQPAAPAGAGSVLRTTVDVVRWYQDDSFPEQAPADPIPFETDWTPTSKEPPPIFKVWTSDDDFPTHIITGTLNTTNANDTLSASGTTTVVGTLNTTNANDTLNASGSPIVSGTLNTTNADDTLSASGTVGTPVSGTLSYTNNNDTLAASGSPVLTGALSTTNANDTMTATGTTTIVGTLATTNNNDVMTAAGFPGDPPTQNSKLPLVGAGPT